MKAFSRYISTGFWLIFVIFLVLSVKAQNNLPKIAILTPEKNLQAEKFTEKLEQLLRTDFRVLDSSLSETAFRSASVAKPFNLTVEEAKIIGAAIGCDFFLLVEAVNLKRYSSVLKEYYESYAVIFAVSSRSGRLIFWTLKTFNGKTPAQADDLLYASTNDLAKDITAKTRQVTKNELTEKLPANYREIPEENSPEAKLFRPPLPYRRISPVYPETARFYRVEATVDVEIYLDETGAIRHLEIVRWAGFGLDESVAETVRRMNWRPAEINGKPVSVRALLRYNFRKPEKESQVLTNF